MHYSPKYNLVFSHYMRTGGSAIGKWFEKTFDDDQKLMTTHWHEPLSNKVKLLKLDDKHLFTSLRNPYVLTHSTWVIWRRFPKGNTGYITKAHEMTFPEFVPFFMNMCQNGTGLNEFLKYEKFYSLNGRIPDNLKFVHQENLQEELTVLIRDEFGIDVDTQLPIYNTMTDPVNPDRKAGEYIFNPDVYTPVTASMVKDTFQWTFDNHYDPDWRNAWNIPL